MAVTPGEWMQATEMEAVLSNVAQLTTIAQHERAWTGAFDVLVGRRLTEQCKPESKLDCIPLDGDMSKIKRVLKLAATDVGKTAQARAYAEAGRRFGKDLTSRQLIAAILDVRTKNLDHFKNSNEKLKAKAALKAAYIAWGKQAHSFSSAILQSHDKQRTIKLEGAGAAEAPPTKKQKVSDVLEWDEEAGEGDVFSSLEHQLEVEFAGVWTVWMRGVNVPWASLFPLAPSSVKQEDPISNKNLEDWLTLDMRVVFKWLSGEAQVVTLAEATKEATKQTVEVHGFAGKMGYLVPMAFAYTGDNIASSFCERMNSAAKNVLTDSRTLLDARELEMVVVLRINRDFMVYMKENHPGVVAAFGLDAQRAAAAAKAEVQ